MTRLAPSQSAVPEGSSCWSSEYLGPSILDCATPGERKADGVVPAHPGGGALRVAKDLWMIFFATLDARGWDANRSIVYQLRRQKPDGPIATEGIVESCREDWDPLGRGDRLFKSCGMPIAFGVPKGATLAGRPAPSANRFVVKWYRWAHLPDRGRLLHPNHHRADWPEGLAMRNRTLRLEWMQFRLRADETDIEITRAPDLLRQRGFESGEAFCALGDDLFTNHAMVPPSPMDADATQWLDCHTFVPCGPERVEHGAIATVVFTFNDRLDRYEWTHVGPMTRLPGRVIGEASVVQRENGWWIAARSFKPDTDTCWFRVDDPLAPMRPAGRTPNSGTPRTIYRSADGGAMLFSNAPSRGLDRSRLCAWRVDLDRMKLFDGQVIADASRLKLPFRCAMIDMAKLCPTDGDGQLLLFRAITRSQTAGHTGDAPPNRREQDQAGIYAARLRFRDSTVEPWQFDRCDLNPDTGATS